MMTRKLLNFRALLAMLLVGLTASTFALAQMNGNVYTLEADEEYPERVDIKVETPTTFYNTKGPDAGMNGGGPYLVQFVPTQGNKLTIKFESLTLNEKSKLHIYNGKIRLDSYYDELEGSDQYSLPRETPDLTLTATTPLANATFTSTDPTGAITIVYEGGYVSGNPNKWKAGLKFGGGAPAPSAFTMPGQKKQQFDIPVEGTIPFYDAGGVDESMNFTGYSLAHFVAKDGTSNVVVKIDQLKLSKGSKLYFYNGKKELTGDSWSLKLPTAQPDLVIDETSTGNITFTGALETGVTVVYDGQYASTYKQEIPTDWQGSLSTVAPTQMVYASTEATVTTLPVTTGARALPILNIVITTKDRLNPLALSAIKTELQDNDNILSNLKLMDEKGDALTFDATTGAVEGGLLSSGANRYTLVADIAPGKAGKSATVTIKSVTVGGTVQSVNAAQTITASDIAYLRATPVTYLVKSPIKLYDDGGPDGKIARDFDGYATFLSAETGKKVSVTFNKLELFIPSFDNGKDDKLEVYDGTQRVADKRLNKYEKELGTTYAIGDEGALTVSLKSTTGANFGNGFEATVDLFTPQAMELDKTQLQTKGEAVTLVPQKSAVEAGSLEINTKYTLDALNLSSVTFGIGTDEAQYLKSISVYDAQGKQLLGTETVAAEHVKVDFTAPIKLSAGKNLFIIKAEAAEKATGGKKINIALKSVATQEGKTLQADASSKTIECITETKAIATVDKQTIYLYSDWEFVSEKKASGSHDNSAGRRVVTFINPDDTKKVEIDFSQFNVTYSYYGGANATYSIYDGENETGNLLWEITKSNCDKGPEAPVRSTGKALTVVINYQGFGYTGGFTSIVRSYEPKPMEVVSSAQQGTGTTAVGLGEKNIPVLSFNITTEGMLTPLTIQKVTFRLAHPEAITSLSLFRKGEVAAKGTVAPSGETFEMTLTEPVTLAERANDFTLNASFADNVASGTKAGFKVEKVTFAGGKDYTIKAPESAIEIELQSIFKHPGDKKNETKTVSGQLTYMDFGGKEKLPKEAMHSSVTFLPKNAGEIITVDVKSLDIARGDKLTVYKGKEIKEENKLFDLSFNRYAGGINHPVFCSDLDVDGGALTFDYNKTSYSYGNYEGWEMTVNSIVPRERFATFVKAEPIAPKSIMLGAQKVGLLHVTLKVDGEKGSAPIPPVKVLNQGFARIALVNGGSGEVYDMNMTETASATGSGEVLLQSDARLAQNGLYNFFVSGDVAANAVVGNPVSVALKAIGENAAEGTAETTFAEGMKGEYTVGSEDANFKDVYALAESLSKGISGAVTILFKSGTYEDFLLVKDVPGVSAVNTLTFKSESGKASDVIFNGEGMPKPRVEPKAYFTVSGTPYVTVENVTFRSTKIVKDYDHQLRAEKGSHYFTVRGCTFDLPTKPSAGSYGTTPRALVIFSETNSATDKDNSHTLVENNTFIGGDIAFEHKGSSGVSKQPTEDVVVRNNTFKNQIFKAIYNSTFIRDYRVEGNTIIADDGYQGTRKDYEAIDVRTGNLNERITGNRIIITKPTEPCGIYLRDNSKRYNDPILVDNNLIIISASGASSSMTGIYVNVASNVKIVHNTIRLSATEAQSNSTNWPLELKYGKDYLVQNNLIQNKASDYAVVLQELEKPTFVHNAYFTNGAVFARYKVQEGTKVNAKEATTFAEWTAYTGEEGAVNQEATFLSDESGALLGGGAFNCGLPYDGITTDITGAKRDSEHPTVGAFEFEDDTTLPLEIKSAFAITQSTSAQVKLVVARNAKLHYSLQLSEQEAPTAEELLAMEPKMVAKQEEITLPFDNLLEAKSYTLYAVLEAVSEIKKTDLLKVLTFTTEIKPTAPATFDDVAGYEAGKPFEDGTMLFTGFTIAKEGNNGIAVLSGASATIQLTNTPDDLALDAFKLRAQSKVTLETNTGKKLEIPGNPNTDWRTIDLKGISPLNSLTITVAEGVAVIDDFGAAPGKLQVKVAEAFTVKEGENATIAFTAPDAVYPLSYQIENANREGLADVWYTQLSEQVSPKTTTEYRITVTDQRGRTEKAYTFVMVNPKDENSFNIADFENPIFLDEGIGKARNTRPMMSGSFSFPLEYNSQYQSFTGVAFSQATDTEYNGDWKTGQYFVPAGKGADNSKGFAIGYLPSNRSKGTIATLSNELIAQPIQGAYFSMTSWQKAYTTNAENGPEDPKGFKDGDFIEVTLTADNGASVVLVLADWRNGKKELMDKWTYTDLTSLGNIRSLYATFKSSRASTFEGVTYDDAPAYLAFDNMGGKPEGNETVFTPDVNRRILVAGRDLVVKGAEGVNVLVYDLSGRLVYSVVATSDDFRRTLPLEDGNYVVVCADKQVKVTLR